MVTPDVSGRASTLSMRKSNLRPEDASTVAETASESGRCESTSYTLIAHYYQYEFFIDVNGQTHLFSFNNVI